jgi:hydroxymethylpyrimidine/phosphomethylpyrimidine kinase
MTGSISQETARHGEDTAGNVSAYPVALTIAGFDPSSGAGITADLKTFSAHGVYGVACISAITVQSTLGVRSVEALSPELARQTLNCLAEDLTLSGVKVGMLGSSAMVREVVSFLTVGDNGVERGRVVLDPILISTSGRPLLDAEGVLLLQQKLLACVGWITPNLSELSALTATGPIGLYEVPAAAVRLKEAAARLGNEELNVVVTGGHLRRPDDFLLASNGEEFWFPGELIHTNATHGTGCAFSSALLCGLIGGYPPATAVARAKTYVAEALRSAYPIGKGRGPMNHLFRLNK